MNNIWLIAIVFGLLIVMMVATVIPQKKKQKKAQEMMSKLAKGDKIKTIGGFVGEIVSIDDETNSMVINLGDETNPINVTIDKAAIYTVINPNKTVVEVDGDKKVAVDADTVKSIDDAEDDAIAQVKADKKSNKKNKKKSGDLAPVEAIDVPAEDIFDDAGTDVKNGDGEVKN